jgi:hypothetical protein
MTNTFNVLEPDNKKERTCLMANQSAIVPLRKLFRLRRFLLLTCVLLSFAGVTAQTKPTKPETIRAVDFANFTYPARPSTGGRGVYTLRNGEHPSQRDAVGHVLGMWLKLASVTYADVTGDGHEEAIVVHAWITGGSATPDVVYVYGMSLGRPRFLWGTTTGDRADGGLKDVYGENGRLVMETFIPEGSQGDCCPVAYVKTEYRYRGGTFRRVRTSPPIPLPPR